jgi:hypothetical protein
MQKIETLFKRDPHNMKLVLNEVNPECQWQWVLNGEGTPTRKWDGQCCMIRGGVLYRRHQRKPDKPLPPKWEHWSGDSSVDHGTGWVPVGEGPEDKWLYTMKARALHLCDGTYEFCGPRVNKNPDSFSEHVLMKHGDVVYPDFRRTFPALRTFFENHDIEGLVWHHPDGRMVKLKGRDFGIARKSAKNNPGRKEVLKTKMRELYNGGKYDPKNAHIELETALLEFIDDDEVTALFDQFNLYYS